MPGYDLAFHITAFLIFIGVLVVAHLIVRRADQRRYEALEDKQAELQKETARAARSENASRLRQEWYRMLFSHTRNMVLVYGVTPEGLPGRFLDANDIACDKLDVSRDRLLRMTPLDIEAPAALPNRLQYTRVELATLSDEDIRSRETAMVRQLIRRIIEKREVDYEHVFLTAKGDRMPVRVHARCVSLQDEDVIICTAEDAIDSRETEQALRDREQTFHDYLAYSPIGVALYNGARKLLEVNSACARMFGMPDRHAFSHFNFFDNPFLPAEVREPLRKGENVRFEMMIDFQTVREQALFLSTRTGMGYYDVFVNNLGLDHAYNPKGYLLQVQDRTKSRQVEAALQHSERQLRQSQKMEAIGTLAGGIAHDFNNILTPVIGYTELMMRMVAQDDPTAEYLDEILKASHRAKDLVQQILTFSRQSETEKGTVPLIPIVKEVLKLLQASFPSNIEVRSEIRTKHDVVIADPTQIHQVLMNFCTNASHAMQAAGGVLQIRLTDFVIGQGPNSEFPDLNPGRYLRVSISDTGTGMTPEVAERIFEPFFTTKKRGEGTGMGLAVVHGIVTGMKGTITLDTEPGKGTTFHVILPTVERKDEVKTVQVAAPVAKGSERVLFVDDEPNIAKMGAHMLASLGYQPVVVGDSLEALRMFKIDPEGYDVVMTDQLMPNMTGLEMAAEMLNLRPDLPIILCTGYSDAAARNQAEELGIRDLLMKPLVMRELAGALRRAIEPKQPVAPA